MKKHYFAVICGDEGNDPKNGPSRAPHNLRLAGKCEGERAACMAAFGCYFTDMWIKDLGPRNPRNMSDKARHALLDRAAPGWVRVKAQELEVGRGYTGAELDAMPQERPAPQGSKIPVWELDWNLNRNTLQFILFDITEDALGHFPKVPTNEGWGRRIDPDYYCALVDWIQSDELPHIPLCAEDAANWPHLAPLVATILLRARFNEASNDYWLFEYGELLDPIWRWLETAPELIILPRAYGPLAGPGADILERAQNGGMLQ